MAKKRFILNDDLSDLQYCKCVMDNYEDVDTWYSLGATVDLLNDYAYENEQLKQKIKSITEILNEDIGYIDSFKKIEEVLK